VLRACGGARSASAAHRRRYRRGAIGERPAGRASGACDQFGDGPGASRPDVWPGDRQAEVLELRGGAGARRGRGARRARCRTRGRPAGEPPALSEAGELGGGGSGERHGPRLARLWRRDRAAGPSRGDGDGRTREPHTPPAEFEQLAHPEAGQRRNNEDGGGLVVRPAPLFALGVGRGGP
jgi:hypothetical protein